MKQFTVPGITFRTNTSPLLSVAGEARLAYDADSSSLLISKDGYAYTSISSVEGPAGPAGAAGATGATGAAGPAGADGASTWGALTGTLADQTDLQDALNAKADTATVDINIQGHADTYFGVHGITAYTASLLDDADAATARATLGVTDVITGDFIDDVGSDSWGLPAAGVTQAATVVTVAVAADAAHFFPFTSYDDVTLTDVAVDVTGAVASAVGEFGLYAATRNVGGGYTISALVASFGTITADTVGLKTITGLSQALVKGQAYALAFVCDQAISMRGFPYDQSVMRLKRDSNVASWAMRINSNTLAASYPLPATLSGQPTKALQATTASYWVFPVVAKWTTP